MLISVYVWSAQVPAHPALTVVLDALIAPPQTGLYVPGLEDFWESRENLSVDGHHRLVGQAVADELGVTGTVRESERQVSPVGRGAEVSPVLVQPPQQSRVRGVDAEQVAAHSCLGRLNELGDQLSLRLDCGDQVPRAEEHVAW